MLKKSKSEIHYVYIYMLVYTYIRNVSLSVI